MCVESQSCTSCGVNWKCHFNVPVSGIERDERIRVQVVAVAIRAVHLRPGIAGAPVEQCSAPDRTNR